MHVTLTVDPGHGGEQPGCSGGGLVEKDLTLELAHNLADVCDSLFHDLTIDVTRKGDETMALSKRGQLSQAANADIVCVLHFDTNADPKAGDLTAYHLDGDDIARLMAQEIEHMAPENLRWHGARADPLKAVVALPEGWTQRGYNVLHPHTGRHPVLVECAFLSNPRHVAFLESTHGMPALALGIMSGLVPGIRVVEANKLANAKRVLTNG